MGPVRFPSLAVNPIADAVGAGLAAIPQAPGPAPVPGQERSQVSEQSLHPEVNRLATSLLGLQDTGSEYRTKVGIVLRISFAGVERKGDDLQSKLNVSIDNREVFAGSCACSGLMRGEKSPSPTRSSGQSTCSTCTFWRWPFAKNRPARYDWECWISKARLSNPDIVQDAVTRIFMQQQQDRDPGGECIPGVDPVPYYGLFPSAGFGYFFGFRGKLEDTPPEKGAGPAR